LENQYYISRLQGRSHRSRWSSFDQTTFRKISKIGTTRCVILRLKCTKITFCWGSIPDAAGGGYSAPPDLLAVFKGPTSK